MRVQAGQVVRKRPARQITDRDARFQTSGIKAGRMFEVTRITHGEDGTIVWLRYGPHARVPAGTEVGFEAGVMAAFEVVPKEEL